MSEGSAATPAFAPTSPLTRTTWIVGVAVAYFLAAKLGLTLATVGVTVTLVWPPSGVAVAAMLLCGIDVWPGVVIGAFLANATTDVPISVALFTAIGNPLEAIVATLLLRHAAGDFHASLERARDVIAFTLFGAALAPVQPLASPVSCSLASYRRAACSRPGSHGGPATPWGSCFLLQ